MPAATRAMPAATTVSHPDPPASRASAATIHAPALPAAVNVLARSTPRTQNRIIVRTLRAAIEAPTKHADSACPPLDEEVELTITAIADSIQGSA